MKDEEFVIHLHQMARKYDSDFLRRVADRMSDMIKELRVKPTTRYGRIDQITKQKQLTELNWDGD